MIYRCNHCFAEKAADEFYWFRQKGRLRRLTPCKECRNTKPQYRHRAAPRQSGRAYYCPKCQQTKPDHAFYRTGAYCIVCWKMYRPNLEANRRYEEKRKRMGYRRRSVAA